MRRILLVLTVLGAGCAARPASTAPTSSIDAYEQDLNAAEARLRAAGVVPEGESSASGSLGAAEAQAAAPPAPAEAPAPEAPAPEADEAAPPRAADKEPPAPGKERAESGCVVACRAFASMKRAADGICEIAGESDARCTQARKRVGDAAELLKKAGCAC